MEQAPVDFIVVRFPGTDLSIDVAQKINGLTKAGTIRVIDLLFVTKDADGQTSIHELTDMDDLHYEAWDAIAGDVFGYLTEEDALLIAESLANNSSAVLCLIENTWAIEMVRTIAEAHGDVLVSQRIPRPVVEQLVMNH